MIQLCRERGFVLKQITHNKGEQAMEFYNVKKSTKVEIAENQCEKVVYKRETAKGVQERYAVKAVDDDGTHLTKFVSKDAYGKLKCPVAK